MKDGLLDSKIDGILDGSKDENSGRITNFASLYAIPKVIIKEHIIESFWEICKHAKRL